MVFLNRFRGTRNSEAQATTTGFSHAQAEFIGDGDIKYAVEQSGNNSGPSYQDASGAPVEVKSPLGYSVGGVTILFLNISMMIGTGVYSTPAGILSGVGSPGLAFIYWTIGFLLSASSLAVYLEYMAYFPNRSGSEVVYLEQAYPKPRYLFPTVFALWMLILSFSSSNCIVLAAYLFQINGHSPSPWELKGVAVAAFTVVIIVLAINTRFAYRVSNGIGVVKLLTLIFVAITGLVVLGGHTRVEDPKANFRKPFAGTSSQPYGLTTSLVYIYFSYGGYNNAFNVVNEVKNPIKAIKIYSAISLSIVYVLYMFANVAYIAAVPLVELKSSRQTAASLFFIKVFGSSGAVKGLNFLVALSAFGNLLAGNIGISRITRECGRQGVLPYPRFWASTRPFGTPTGPYLIKYILTVLMILAPPAGDAFNFIVSLQLYPYSIFNVFVAVGIYFVRNRRAKLGLPRGEFRAWDVVVVFNILVNLYLVVMPWYPPASGRNGGNVSFWYGTSTVTGIAVIIICVAYYFIWIYAIPYWRGYRIRQTTVLLEDGANTHTLVKVPLDQLAEWDRTHDPSGKLIDDDSGLEREAASDGQWKGATTVDSEVKV